MERLNRYESKLKHLRNFKHLSCINNVLKTSQYTPDGQNIIQVNKKLKDKSIMCVRS